MSARGKGKKPDKKGKGKKGKKGEKDDSHRLTEVDRQFYELYIEDAKKKIAHIKEYLETLNKNNADVVETVRSLWEDKTDVCADYTRELGQKNDEIIELEENIIEMQLQIDFERNENNMKIRDLQAKYKAMHNQLGSEIKILNGKLNALDDFHKHWFELIKKFDEADEDLKEMERQHKQALLDFEEKKILMREAIRKEVESKLLQVSEDFMHSSEQRNSGYTRRLIRENIAIQKEIFLLIVSQRKIEKHFQDAMERHFNILTNMCELEAEKKGLIISAQQKVELIEKLTWSYEKLKCAYTENLKYPGLYRDLMTAKLCARFAFKKRTKELRRIRQEIEMLKHSNALQRTMNIQHEDEIYHLRGLIDDIKIAVQASIRAGPGGIPPIDYKLDPGDPFILHLLKIIHRAESEIAETPSVSSISRSGSSLYRPGFLGFLPSSESLMEPFKIDPDDIESIQEELHLQKEASIIIPQERIANKYAIIDVESGSTLYYSSDRGNIEMLAMEEQQAESDDKGSDEFGSSSLSSGPTTKKATESESAQQLGTVSSTQTVAKLEEDAKIEPPKVKTESFIVDVGEVEEGGEEEEEGPNEYDVLGEEEEEIFYF